MRDERGQMPERGVSHEVIKAMSHEGSVCQFAIKECERCYRPVRLPLEVLLHEIHLRLRPFHIEINALRLGYSGSHRHFPPEVFSPAAFPLAINAFRLRGKSVRQMGIGIRTTTTLAAAGTYTLHTVHFPKTVGGLQRRAPTGSSEPSFLPHILQRDVQAVAGTWRRRAPSRRCEPSLRAVAVSCRCESSLRAVVVCSRLRRFRLRSTYSDRGASA